MTTPNAPDNSIPAAPQPPRRKRRWLRRLLWSLAILVVLLVLLVLALPTLVSTGPGVGLILSFANDAIQGHADVAGLSLGWFSGTSVQGVKLSDPQGRSVIEVGRLDAPGVTLLGLVRGNLDLGKITIADVKGTIVQNADGTTNLNQALAPRHPAAAPSQTPARPAASGASGGGKPMDLSRLKLALELQNINVSYTQPDQPPIELALHASAQAAGLHQLELSDLHVDLGQGDGHGTLDGKATVRGLLDDTGQPHLDQFTVAASLTGANLPVPLADALARQQGKLVALLGPVLNLALTAKGGSNDAQVSFHADSQQLHVQTAVTLHDNVLTVNQPSGVHFTLTPQALAKLTAVNGKPPAFTLLQPAALTVQFHRASARVGGDHFDPRAAELDLTLNLSDVALDGGPGVGAMSLTGTQGSIKFAGADHSKLQVSLASSAAYAPQPGTPAQAGQVGLDATVLDLLAADGKLNLAGLTAQINAHIANWPLAVVDQLLGQKGLVVTAIGPTLGADLAANLQPDAAGTSAHGDVAVTLKSQNVNGTLAAAVSNDRIKTTRTPAAALSIHLTRELLPLLLAQYAPKNPQLQTLALAQDADLTVTLTSLELPLKNEKGPLAGLSVSAGVALPRRGEPGALMLTGVPTAGTLDLDGLTVTLNYDGPKQALAAEVHTRAGLSAGVVPLDVTAGLSHFLDQQGKFVQSASVAKASVQIQDLPVSMLNDPRLVNLKIPALRLDVPESTLGGNVKAIVDLPMSWNGQSASIHAEADLTDPLGKTPRYRVTARVEKLPLALADTLGQLDGLLTNVLGDTLDNAQVTLTPDDKDPANLLWSITVQSPRLAVDCGGAFKPGDRLALRSDKDSVLQLTLTPQALDGINAWMMKRGAKDLGLELTEPASYRLALRQTDVVFPAPPAPGTKDSAVALPLDFAKTRFPLTLTNPGTALRLKDTQDQVRLNNLNFALTVPSLTGKATLALKSDLQTTLAPVAGAAPASPQTGSIDMAANIASVLDVQGRVDRLRLTLEADNVAFKGLPVGLVDHLMGMGGLLPAALGPTADATIKAIYGPDGGTFDLSANSPNLTVKIAAALTKDQQLKLRSAPTIELKATPQLFAQLAHINPMLAGIQSAEKPVKLTANPATFLVPLGAANSQELMQGMTIDAGLEVGKVTMNAAPFTQGLIGLLLQFMPGATVNNTFNATLSPLQVHLAKGVLSTTTDTWLTSTDLVVGKDNSPKLAAFGMRIDRLDLTTKDSLVRVALPGLMLGQFPYMQKAFPTDYIYETVQQGPIDQIKPDYDGLIKQMALMAAKAQGVPQLQSRLSGLSNNPLVAALAQKGSEDLTNKLLGMVPQTDQQSDIIKRWPNRPTKLPSNVTIDQPAAAQPQTPPANTPQQPQQPQQPPPPQPQRPLIPLPRLPHF